jgi:hypothetical protein
MRPVFEAGDPDISGIEWFVTVLLLMGEACVIEIDDL